MCRCKDYSSLFSLVSDVSYLSPLSCVNGYPKIVEPGGGGAGRVRGGGGWKGRRGKG